MSDEQKAQIIVVWQKKGGVGKTFLATSVAHGLASARMDSRVLLVDLDSQGVR